MGEIVPLHSRGRSWPDQAGQLDRTGQFVLRSGLRPWVAAMRCGVDPLSEVRETIAEAGGPAEVAGPINDLMYGVAMQSVREIVIGCPHCTSLSPDETLLLHALAEAARGADHPAALLAPLVRPVALSLLDFPLISLARGLGAAGWRFHRRALPPPNGSDSGR
jgi:hypothetical protein